MSAFVVLLKSKKLISVCENWIKNPILGAQSLVFFSPNNNDVPKFDLEPTYFFQLDNAACYEAHVLKRFGKTFSIILSFYRDLIFTNIYSQNRLKLVKYT